MSRFTIIDAEQRSAEWYAARRGRLTGSVAGDMLAKIKSGEAAARRNLRLKLVLERLTGKSQESDFMSPAMIAGLDREAGAIAAYQVLTDTFVQPSGFLALNGHMAGCSLDGHLGDFETLLSLKCRQPAAHFDFLRSGKVPADALAQMRHELWVTGAREHHYFSWNPDFPEALQSRLVKVSRADADVDGYEIEALAFLSEVAREIETLGTLADLKTQFAAAVA